MTLLWQFANTKLRCFVYSANMEAMRSRWTDDRMDDLVQRVDAGFAQVDARFAQVDARFAQVDARFTEVHEDIAALRVDNKELRGEMSHLATRKELQAEIKTVRSEMREGFDKVDKAIAAINRRFDTLILTLIAAMITVVVT